MAAPANRFRLSDFLLRWLYFLALLTATYNFSGYSYVDWVLTDPYRDLPWKLLAGIVLVGLYIFTVGMAWRTLGLGWSLFGVAIFATVTWALSTIGVVWATTEIIIVWVQVWVAGLLAAGLSIAPIRQQVSGQVTATEAGGHV